MATPEFNTLSETWSDYNGNAIYGDFDAVNGDQRSYTPGIGMFDWSSGAPDTTSVAYYHTDMIGTTRFMSDDLGNDVLPAKYTAFGERQVGDARRYGYVGAYGYQSDASNDIPFMHVGHRWYDPSVGRFLQRDPIGVGGGSNVYLYTGASPLIFVDPLGLDFSSDFSNFIEEGRQNAQFKANNPPPPPAPVPPVAPKPPPPPHAPINYLTDPGDFLAYCAFGGIGAVVGEFTILITFAPLYSDVKPGDIMNPYLEGVGEVWDKTIGGW